jgi:hypothetical protein
VLLKKKRYHRDKNKPGNKKHKYVRAGEILLLQDIYFTIKDKMSLSCPITD